MDLKAAMTQKYGPLTAWQWGIAAGIVGYLFLRNQKKSPAAAGDLDATGAEQPGAGATPGEFQSQQSQTKIDPETGEQLTSSYSASGPLGGWGGGVGLPMAYPMPYQGGDVYVNLPGDSQNLNPSSPGNYPPKTGPGTKAGVWGGYWWTPKSMKDATWLGQTAYALQGPTTTEGQRAALAAINYLSIREANPQIDWSKITDPAMLVGTPLYVPPKKASATNIKTYMPSGASLNAPAGYAPPTQTTGVSGTGT